MHLINTHTLRLEKFVKEENEKPVSEYAILSHRWLDREDEVSFQDMESADPQTASQRKGYFKILETCKLARSQSLDYMWIDTCCINKTDSSELQEAINSMYRWYENATVCFAHLSDTVHTAKGRDLSRDLYSVMRNDAWFSRGWTLQELVAPRNLLLYDSNWKLIGNKKSLSWELQLITGVDAELLEGVKQLHDFCIAQRMSWACGRFTTRPEDSTYSLFGIFGINMPMLYGEGRERAFLRLQEEIIKSTDDESIFAWEGGNTESGMLAKRLGYFSKCQYVRRRPNARRKNYPYSVTNKGLHITLPLIPFTLNTYQALLDCTVPGEDGGPQQASILLVRLDADDQYSRIPLGPWGKTESKKHIDVSYAKEVSMYISHSGKGIRGVSGPQRQFFFHIHVEGLETTTLKFQAAQSMWCGVWEADYKTPHFIRVIRVWFDFGFNPIVILGESSAEPEDLECIQQAMPNTVALAGEGSSLLLNHPSINLNRMHNYPPESTTMRIEKHNEHGGIWALRGDRIDGLQAMLSGTGEKVVIGRQYDDKDLAWVLSIGNTDESLSDPDSMESNSGPSDESSEGVSTLPPKSRRERRLSKLVKKSIGMGESELNLV
ncbi:HET-domain-containing protein [Xylariaceae sp. FL1272]|nr:HET-domain-containing protein [Xylariaceae sp. FL1272]